MRGLARTGVFKNPTGMSYTSTLPVHFIYHIYLALMSGQAWADVERWVAKPITAKYM